MATQDQYPEEVHLLSRELLRSIVDASEGRDTMTIVLALLLAATDIVSIGFDCDEAESLDVLSQIISEARLNG